MSKPRDDRQKDLLRPPLDQIIDLGHPLARLAREIDWSFFDERFSSVCRAGAGQARRPLMKDFYAPLFGSRDVDLLRRLRFVRYEDLVVNSYAAAAELKKFTGLDLSGWSPENDWSYANLKISGVDNPRRDAITPLYGKPVSVGCLQAYEDMLSKEEIAVIEAETGTFMRYFNYI